MSWVGWAGLVIWTVVVWNVAYTTGQENSPEYVEQRARDKERDDEKWEAYRIESAHREQELIEAIASSELSVDACLGAFSDEIEEEIKEMWERDFEAEQDGQEPRAYWR